MCVLTWKLNVVQSPVRPNVHVDMDFGRYP